MDMADVLAATDGLDVNEGDYAGGINLEDLINTAQIAPENDPPLFEEITKTRIRMDASQSLNHLRSELAKKMGDHIYCLPFVLDNADTSDENTSLSSFLQLECPTVDVDVEVGPENIQIVDICIPHDIDTMLQPAQVATSASNVKMDLGNGIYLSGADGDHVDVESIAPMPHGNPQLVLNSQPVIMPPPSKKSRLEQKPKVIMPQRKTVPLPEPEKWTAHNLKKLAAEQRMQTSSNSKKAKKKKVEELYSEPVHVPEPSMVEARDFLNTRNSMQYPSALVDWEVMFNATFLVYYVC